MNYLHSVYTHIFGESNWQLTGILAVLVFIYRIGIRAANAIAETNATLIKVQKLLEVHTVDIDELKKDKKQLFDLFEDQAIQIGKLKHDKLDRHEYEQRTA